jgi:hypothetical protein
MHDASTTSALPSPTSTLTAFIVGLGPEAEGPIFVEGEFLDTCDRTRRDLAHFGGLRGHRRHAPTPTSAFEPVETFSVDWQDPMNPSDLAGLVTTRSYYLTASAGAQRQIRERAAAILGDHFFDADHIALPYGTHCYRTGLAGNDS